MIFIIIVFVLILIPADKVRTAQQSIIYARGIFCNGNPDYIANQSCYIKAVRGKTGLINTQITFKKPLIDILNHGELFYRYGTIYRQWLVKFDIDVCELTNGKSNNAFVRLGVDALRVFDPTIIRPCPTLGFSIKDQDIDSGWQKFVPPAFPAGHYKLVLNFHTSKNVTIIEIVVKFERKGIGLADLTMLNMG